MFKQAGQFEGKILETMFAEARFAKDDPNAFDVCLKIQGPDFQGQPQVAWWSGEMSGKYGRGNFANRTQAQITMENLHSIGFEGQDLTQLDAQLRGKTIPFTVEAREYDGKTYYDIKYIGGGGFVPKPINTGSVNARFAAMMKGATSAATKPQPTATNTSRTANDDVPW